MLKAKKTRAKKKATIKGTKKNMKEKKRTFFLVIFS